MTRVAISIDSFVKVMEIDWQLKLTDIVIAFTRALCTGCNSIEILECTFQDVREVWRSCEGQRPTELLVRRKDWRMARSKSATHARPHRRRIIFRKICEKASSLCCRDWRCY